MIPITGVKMATTRSDERKRGHFYANDICGVASKNESQFVFAFSFTFKVFNVASIFNSNKFIYDTINSLFHDILLAALFASLP